MRIYVLKNHFINKCSQKIVFGFLSILVSLASVTSAHAITPKQFFDLPYSSSVFKDGPDKWANYNFGFDLRYQIGDEWGKKPVTNALLDSNPILRKMALATARVRGGGTGFYLGEFNGRYIVATNHHVCPAEWECMGMNAIDFPFLKFKTSVIEFYGSWPEVDLALFAIAVPSDKVSALEEVASPFQFNEELYRGQKLLTVGFGVADNPSRQMVVNQDSDCLVFSGHGEYRLMADPDKLNPGTYKAWSFANGCDVSHGDSGSAMVDRETGKVIGIIWTGVIPKNEKIQSSQYLRELLEAPNEDVWQELSYGVPAVHMKRYLLEQIASGSIDSRYVETLRELF